MKDNYLLVVEGTKTEKNIFQNVLEKYGFNVIDVKEKLDVENVGQLESLEFSNERKNVIMIQGPKNRIHDFLKMYNEKEDSIEKAFSLSSTKFKGIFLMYDVDHNDQTDIEEMFAKFQDESSGMLLLSSPCIEVLGEYDFHQEARFNHLKEYKSRLNTKYNIEGYNSVEDYIIKNFDEACIKFLDLNYKEFNEPNIMEHPSLIIKSIAKNERINYPKNRKEESYVIYRYFTTVVYVFVAYINGLTSEIENYKIVRDYFLSNWSVKRD